MRILEDVKQLESILERLVDDTSELPRNEKEYKEYEEAERILRDIIDRRDLPIALEHTKHSQQDYWG